MKLHDPDIVIGSTTYDAEDLGIPSLRCYSCGRLTAVSGDPCPIADTASTTSVYLTPYRGNVLTLLDGSDDYEHLTFAETELELGTLTSGKNYTVYAYNDSGTLTLAFSAAWTDDVTESEARETVKGLVVKASDHTRRIVGVIRTISTTATCDVGGGVGGSYAASKRYVASLINPVWRRIFCCPGYADDNTTDTYTSASTAPTEPTFGGSSHRPHYVIAEAIDSNVWIGSQCRVVLPAVQYQSAYWAIADDGTAVDNIITFNEFYAGAGTHTEAWPTLVPTTRTISKAVGHHYFAALVFLGIASGTATYYSNARAFGMAADIPFSAMSGMVLI